MKKLKLCFPLPSLSSSTFPFSPSLFPCVCFVVWWFSFCPLFPSLPPLSRSKTTWTWSRTSGARATPGRSTSLRWDVRDIWAFPSEAPISKASWTLCPAWCTDTSYVINFVVISIIKWRLPLLCIWIPLNPFRTSVRSFFFKLEWSLCVLQQTHQTKGGKNGHTCTLLFQLPAAQVSFLYSCTENRVCPGKTTLYHYVSCSVCTAFLTHHYIFGHSMNNSVPPTAPTISLQYDWQ